MMARYWSERSWGCVGVHRRQRVAIRLQTAAIVGLRMEAREWLWGESLPNFIRRPWNDLHREGFQSRLSTSSATPKSPCFHHVTSLRRSVAVVRAIQPLLPIQHYRALLLLLPKPHHFVASAWSTTTRSAEISSTSGMCSAISWCFTCSSHPMLPPWPWICWQLRSDLSAVPRDAAAGGRNCLILCSFHARDVWCLARDSNTPPQNYQSNSLLFFLAQSVAVTSTATLFCLILEETADIL